jgi:hypothetical protein
LLSGDVSETGRFKDMQTDSTETTDSMRDDIATPSKNDSVLNKK